MEMVEQTEQVEEIKNLFGRVLIVDEISEKYHMRGRIINGYDKPRGSIGYMVLFGDMSAGYYEDRKDVLLVIG